MLRCRTRLNVVLFPLSRCAIDFEQLTELWLAEQLALPDATSIQIIRKSATFARINCRTWAVKRYLLTWAVRVAALEHLDIRVKEDLLRYERAQKNDMWFVMTTLHAAYFYPTWNRANVAWKVQGKWFEVHPGEIPPCFTALQIEEYCSRKCGYPKVNSTIDPVEEVEHQSGQTQPQQLVTLESCQLPCLEDKSTQTQHTGAPKYKELQNSVTSLRQDVSTEKYQTAKKTSECCELRRKLYIIVPIQPTGFGTS